MDDPLTARQDPHATAQRAGVLRRLAIWGPTVAFLLLVGGVAGVFGGRLWARLAGDAGDVRVVQSTAGVVAAVRDLARLEGAEYRMERVISLTDKQGRLYGLIQVEDAILLVASGTVTAGVDLSLLRDGDVAVDEGRRAVRFSLPSSTVLRATLDSDRTFVFRRETDLLARRKEALEADARQEAERALRKGAEEGGIVERSNANVQKTVESLVRTLGFTSITVEFRNSPEPGER